MKLLILVAILLMMGSVEASTLEVCIVGCDYTSTGLYSTLNLYNGPIDHNTASAKLSGGGVYSVYGTSITGNKSPVHENTPDQIRIVGA